MSKSRSDSVEYHTTDKGIVIGKKKGDVVVQAQLLPTYEKNEILKTTHNVVFGKVKKVHKDGLYDIKLKRHNLLLERIPSHYIDFYREQEEGLGKKLNPLMKQQIDEFLRHSRISKKKKKPKGRGRSTKKAKKSKKSKKKKTRGSKKRRKRKVSRKQKRKSK